MPAINLCKFIIDFSIVLNKVSAVFTYVFLFHIVKYSTHIVTCQLFAHGL